MLLRERCRDFFCHQDAVERLGTERVFLPILDRSLSHIWPASQFSRCYWFVCRRSSRLLPLTPCNALTQKSLLRPPKLTRFANGIFPQLLTT